MSVITIINQLNPIPAIKQLRETHTLRIDLKFTKKGMTGVGYNLSIASFPFKNQNNQCL